MENTGNNYNYSQVNRSSNSGNDVRIMAIIGRCAKNWYWFVVSVFVCLVAGGLKVLSTMPTYDRNADVLVKETAMRRLATSDLESMLSGSSGPVSAKVVNEVISFQSPALMQEVVKRLNVNTSYYTAGLFRNSIIYGIGVPFTTEFPDLPSNAAVEINVVPRDAGFEITGIRYSCAKEKEKYTDAIAGSFGDTLSTPVGRMVFNRNEYFKGDFDKEIIVEHSSLNAATSFFLSNFTAVSVDPKNNSDVIRLQMSDYSVQRADDLINTIIAVYNENWVSDKNKMAISTSRFINVRLDSLKRELGNVDELIASYKSKNLIPDLSGLSSFYLEQTRENTAQIMELESQIYLYNSIQSYLRDNSGTEELLPLVTGSSGSGINSQIEKYNETLLLRNDLLSNSSEKNPLVLNLNEALVSMKASLDQGITAEIANLKNKLDALYGSKSNISSRLADNPSQAKYLATIGREQKVKETLYLYLLQKREENELSQAFAAYNIRLVTPPMGIAKKAAPLTSRIMFVAFLIGLFIPFAVIYVLIQSDTKIRSRKDIENISLPFLGEIPQYGSRHGIKGLFKKDVDATEPVVKPGKRDVVNEAFRVLRTNLEMLLRDQKSPVIVFSSFNPGSGKTFLSVNTSIVLAIKNKKVLAIDGDMRHASLSEYVGSPKKGLSTYLSGAADDFHPFLCRMGGVTSLDVLPVGALPPNPAELIGSERLQHLLEIARKEYDYIFIDCPPIDIVADTHIVEELADRTIFVVRAGLLEKSMVPQLDKLESSGKLKLPGLILNGITSGDSVYGSGYYSSKYSSYYYHKDA